MNFFLGQCLVGLASADDNLLGFNFFSCVETQNRLCNPFIEKLFCRTFVWLSFTRSRSRSSSISCAKGGFQSLSVGQHLQGCWLLLLVCCNACWPLMSFFTPNTYVCLFFLDGPKNQILLYYNWFVHHYPWQVVRM